jgi:hypothetical protein
MNGHNVKWGHVMQDTQERNKYDTETPNYTTAGSVLVDYLVSVGIAFFCRRKGSRFKTAIIQKITFDGPYFHDLW